MKKRSWGSWLLCGVSFGALLFGCGDDAPGAVPDGAQDASSSSSGVASGSSSGAPGASSGGSSGGAPGASSGGASGSSSGGETEPDTQPVSLDFRAVVGAQDFACGQAYDGVGTPAGGMSPVDFRFYVHDVRLVGVDGGEIPLQLAENEWQHQGVALLDFEDGRGDCVDGDAATNTSIVGHVPLGVQFTGVKFRLGVPFELNHQDLATKPAPLDKSSLFWAWNSGHIFLTAVAKVRRPSEAAPEVWVPYVHYTHIGSVGCVGEPALGVPVSSCAKPNRPEVALAHAEPLPESIALRVDFAQIKQGTDLTGVGCHANGAQCAPAYAHLGVDWETGEYLPQDFVTLEPAAQP